MSDLTGKFGGFESQIGTNHTEIMAALNSLIEGIGGVPTTPSATLADVVTALTTINSNIVGMRSANALYYASALEFLEAINTNTDTIINNNSLNAQRTIQAIYATFCDCATDTPLLAPPIDTTPTPLEIDEKCRRVQFYLAVFTTWLTSIANYGSTGASITGGVLETLLAGAAAAFGLTATGAEVGAAAGIPGAIAGAVVGAIVAAVYALGGSVLIDYANQFASTVVQDDLRQALYGANNADEGQSAFQSVIAANFSPIPAGIINFLWWSAWSNDLYSATPVVDDSAFDGTICAPPPTTGCTTLINASYSGENQIFIYETYNGYDYYHVRVTNATGNFNSAIVINGVLQTNPYGNHEEYWTTAQPFGYQAATYYPGSGDVFVEGCYGTAP